MERFARAAVVQLHLAAEWNFGEQFARVSRILTGGFEIRNSGADVGVGAFHCFQNFRFGRAVKHWREGLETKNIGGPSKMGLKNFYKFRISRISFTLTCLILLNVFLLGLGLVVLPGTGGT